jgi:hypothetical protein
MFFQTNHHSAQGTCTCILNRRYISHARVAFILRDCGFPRCSSAMGRNAYLDKNRKHAFKPPHTKMMSCITGGYQTEAFPLQTETIDGYEFTKVAKQCAWLCHAALGHSGPRSRVKNSEVFELIRGKMKQAKKQLYKQARKQSMLEDKMSLLTGQLVATKVNPSRSRGKSLVPKGGSKAHGQPVTILMPDLPDNPGETKPRVLYAPAKPSGGRSALMMRVDDLPWLVNYMHAECGESSDDEESSSGSSSSYGSPHYDAKVGVLRIKVKMPDGEIKKNINELWLRVTSTLQ